ncbi:hypothetical protein ACFX1Q_010710 [Malus domestica]
MLLLPDSFNMGMGSNCQHRAIRWILSLEAYNCRFPWPWKRLEAKACRVKPRDGSNVSGLHHRAVSSGCHCIGCIIYTEAKCVTNQFKQETPLSVELYRHGGGLCFENGVQVFFPWRMKHKLCGVKSPVNEQVQCSVKRKRNRS